MAQPCSATLSVDDSDQYDHDRDHQQNVYEAPHGVRGNYSQQPQNEHDDSNGIKHDLFLSLVKGYWLETPIYSERFKSF
jgi:hypothetical protein